MYPSLEQGVEVELEESRQTHGYWCLLTGSYVSYVINNLRIPYGEPTAYNETES